MSEIRTAHGAQVGCARVQEVPIEQGACAAVRRHATAFIAASGLLLATNAAAEFPLRVGKDDAYPDPAVSFAGGVTGVPDVVYATRYGYRPLKLDLYLPAATRKTARPLLVFVHGGAWVTGHKRHGGVIADFPSVLASIAGRGYVVASIEYRLRNEATFPAAIQDVRDALRFLRRESITYAIDPARVGIFGPSAGGHLAALAATSCGVAALEADRGEQAPDATATVSEPGAECVQAAAAWFGVYDFRTVPTPPGGTGPGPFLGCKGPCTAEVLAFASPANYVDARDPPMLLLHGSADRRVAVSQTVEFDQRLTQAGVPVETVLIAGVDHGFVGATDAETVSAYARALDLTLAFFDRALRAAPGATSQGSRRDPVRCDPAHRVRSCDGNALFAGASNKQAHARAAA